MASEQIFLFTGDNTFALNDERRRWEQGFIVKYGADNLLHVPGSRMTVRDLLDDIAVAPFLSPKRLVVIEGVPKLSKEDVQRLVDGIHPAVVLLFIDVPGQKQRTGGKELAAAVTVKLFPEISGKSLKSWVDQVIKEEGATFVSGAIERLITVLGGDQESIVQEVRTLALRCTGRTVTVADIDEMVLPVEGVVWTVTDALAAGRTTHAVSCARDLLVRGTEPFALWNSIVSFVKNVTAVHAALESGSTDPKTVSERSGVHIFAIRSLLPCAKRLSRPSLRTVLDRVVSLDTALKTGELRTTDEAPQELLAAIDSVLLRFP